MSADARSLKPLIRNQLRARSQSVPAMERAAQSARLRNMLLVQTIWIEARSVLFYFPTALEPDMLPLVANALAEGKQVALPRYVDQKDHYETRLVSDLARDLEAGQFNIPEPKTVCSVFPLNQLDLALAPGLGFDLGGWRLGRGKGYYDRLLARVPGHKCGVAFDWQIVKEIPRESHDLRLNSILTPARWYDVVS